MQAGTYTFQLKITDLATPAPNSVADQIKVIVSPATGSGYQDSRRDRRA